MEPRLVVSKHARRRAAKAAAKAASTPQGGQYEPCSGGELGGSSKTPNANVDLDLDSKSSKDQGGGKLHVNFSGGEEAEC